MGLIKPFISIAWPFGNGKKELTYFCRHSDIREKEETKIYENRYATVAAEGQEYFNYNWNADKVSPNSTDCSRFKWIFEASLSIDCID